MNNDELVEAIAAELKRHEQDDGEYGPVGCICDTEMHQDFLEHVANSLLPLISQAVGEARLEEAELLLTLLVRGGLQPTSEERIAETVGLVKSRIAVLRQPAEKGAENGS